MKVGKFLSSKSLVLFTVIVLLFSVQHKIFAGPQSGVVHPMSEKEDRQEDIQGGLIDKYDLKQFSVSELLIAWKAAATLRGKNRNQKQVEWARRQHDLESEIDSRNPGVWKPIFSNEEKEAHYKKTKAMLEVFNKMKENAPFPVIVDWYLPSKDRDPSDRYAGQTSAFGTNTLFEQPKKLRDVYYLLTEMKEPSSGAKAMIAGVYISRTPPKGVSIPIGYRQVDFEDQIYDPDSHEGKKIDPPKYVLYVSPDVDYEQMMNLYESILERIMLEQTEHVTAALEKLSDVNKDFCGVDDKFIEEQKKIFEEQVKNFPFKSLDNIISDFQKSEKLNSEEMAKLNISRGKIIAALNERLRVVQASEKYDQDKVNKILQLIYQVQTDQIPTERGLYWGWGNGPGVMIQVGKFFLQLPIDINIWSEKKIKPQVQ